ncbi:MAG TPA: glutamine amidotransferase [Bacillota bacterium]|nr:glutamine amidotransferase [Bacillota bacterium]
MSFQELRILHLYPELMNLYGDRGNLLALRARCRWHEVKPIITEAGPGDPVDFADLDLVVLGGGQDREQRLVARDLAGPLGCGLRAAVEEGLCVLAVCGSYQLLGNSYTTAGGETFPGAGIFDLATEPGLGRLVGHIAVAVGEEGRVLAGFENHAGRTFLGPGVTPLGRVIRGYGNNGRDGTEGAVCRNAFGTYLHGPVLPANPWFADHLLHLALERRYGMAGLRLLDDSLELGAHAAVLRESRIDARRRARERGRARREEQGTLPEKQEAI